MNIFSKKDDGQVNVPEIEVRGDEVTVRKDDEEQDQGQDRKVKLPKTKWF